MTKPGKKRNKLPKVAKRLAPKAVWDDLVLPEEERMKLHEIAARMTQRDKVKAELDFKPKSARGLAIKALFAGPSRTGKTMAAEILANELQLDLFRIDLEKLRRTCTHYSR